MRLLLLVAVACACSSEPPRQKAPPPAEEPREMGHTWDGDDLRIDSGRLSFACCVGDPSRPYARAEGLRPGTRFTIGATTWEGSKRQQVDIAPHLGALDLHESKQVVALGVPVKVATPGPWKVIETVAPPAKVNRHQAPLVLGHIVEQPLPFVIDVADDPVDTVYLVDLVRPPRQPVRGAGKKLADVDWVAVATWKPTGKQKVCGGYSRTPGVPGSEKVTIGLNDIELAVYDRRSGKKLGAKVFPSATACPASARAGADGIGPAEAPIVAWLDAAIARGSLE
jgi:hypothetical protein